MTYKACVFCGYIINSDEFDNKQCIPIVVNYSFPTNPQTLIGQMYMCRNCIMTTPLRCGICGSRDAIIEIQLNADGRVSVGRCEICRTPAKKLKVKQENFEPKKDMFKKLKALETTQL